MLTKIMEDEILHFKQNKKEEEHNLAHDEKENSGKQKIHCIGWNKETSESMQAGKWLMHAGKVQIDSKNDFFCPISESDDSNPNSDT